jgi:hypothetical protein
MKAIFLVLKSSSSELRHPSRLRISAISRIAVMIEHSVDGGDKLGFEFSDFFSIMTRWPSDQTNESFLECLSFEGNASAIRWHRL